MIKRINGRLNNKHRIVLLIIALLLILLIVLIVLMVNVLNSMQSKQKLQKDMEEYLEKRYEREFVVEKPFKTGYFQTGYEYVSNAYPKDEEDLEFYVSVLADDLTDYTDMYLSTKVQKEGREHIQKELDQIYGKDYMIEKYRMIIHDTNLKKMDYKNLMENDVDRIYKIVLNCIVFIDGNLDKNKEAEKVYNFVKDNYINYSADRYFMSFDYVKREKKKDLEELLSRTKPGDGERARLYEKGISVNWLKIDHVFEKKDIESPEEMITKFQYE